MFKSRYRQILRFFFSVIAGVVWWEVILTKTGFRGLARRTRSRRMRRVAVAFRSLAAGMGGVLIKVGQFLSARLDVLPREITVELSALQDEVGAEKFEDIRKVIETEFRMPLSQSFVEFEPVPLASASIGQVHRARLCHTTPDGKPCPPVVVKVQRPHIQQIVESDLAAVRVVGGWLARFAFIKKHADVHALIEEFSRTLYEEMDYLNEGKNAERFAANFKDRPDVLTPKVVWSHTSRRVLTLQDVGAIKITDYAGIESAGVDRGEVAKRLVDTYLQQIFEDGFFHADPHPGNLFVLPDPTNGSRWRLVFVDFGMTGTLAANTFNGLRDALIAVGTRDAARLVDSYKKLNLLLPGADLELLERANRRVFDTIWGRAAKDIMDMSSDEVKRFVDEFRDLLYEMPFQVPQDLILLGRCLSILAGMAIGLDPDFNVWNALAPHARKLIEADGQSGIRLAAKETVSFLRLLAALPGRLDSLISHLEQGRLDVRLPEMRQHVARLESGFKKLAGSIVFAAVLMCGTAFYIADRIELAVASGVVAGCILLWTLFRR